MSEVLRREILASARAELDARKPVQRRSLPAREVSGAPRDVSPDAVFDPYGGAG